MKTIGVIHRTYHNRKAFRFAFENFRKFFPESPYVILSDDGDDFSEYVDEFTHYVRTDVRAYGTGPDSVWYDRMEILFDFYYRIKQACEITKTDYLLDMEDDVYVKKAFQIDDDFNLCGPCRGEISKNMINFIKRNTSTTQEKFYYGFSGGAILNCKAFLENYDSIIESAKKHYKEYSDNLTEHIAMVGDGNLTFHFYLLGLGYSCSKWLVDGTMIHPFKDYYE
jgi:hypothetical protein